MLLELKRRVSTADATEGDLFIDGAFFCYTIEDTLRMKGEKIAGKTAIPTGTYPVTITPSNRFRDKEGKMRLMPLLLDVPNFEGIRIHCGNTAADTDGCVLIGTDRTSPNDGRIGGSRDAFDKFFPLLSEALKHGTATMKITNPPLASMAQHA